MYLLTLIPLHATQALNQTLQTSYGASASKAKPQSPKDAVGASLQAAFNAAAAAAASVTAPFASWGHAAAHTLPVQAMTSQLQGAAAAGQTTAVATMATVWAVSCAVSLCSAVWASSPVLCTQHWASAGPPVLPSSSRQHDCLPCHFVRTVNVTLSGTRICCRPTPAQSPVWLCTCVRSSRARAV